MNRTIMQTSQCAKAMLTVKYAFLTLSLVIHAHPIGNSSEWLWLHCNQGYAVNGTVVFRLPSGIESVPFLSLPTM